MKVLLISPNRERLPDPVFPIGLAYIAAALYKSGHDLDVVDLCFVEDVEVTLRSSIQTFSPEVIGISFRNIDDVSYPRSVSYLPLYREVIEICRRYSDAPIVGGGSGFTIMPGEFMENLNIDYGVVGEGEVAIVHLMRYLSEGGGVPEGVVSKGHIPYFSDKRRFSSMRKIEKYGMCPHRHNRDWERLKPLREVFSIKNYYEKGGMLNIQTKRGCPFSCIYCSYPKIEGKAIRARSIEDVVYEIEEIVEQTGVRHFFIVDSIFNYPREYALRFCKEVVNRGLNIEWNCYANPGLMDSELIEMMLKAGCSGVEFGTDSLIDDILDNLKKGFRYKQVKEISRLCKELGLKFCHFIFLGAPGEGPQDVKKNMERLSSINADSSVIMVGIRIFPGTELSLIAKEELGIEIEKIGLEPVYYISPRLFNEIERIVEKISSEHKNWVFPGFEINFNERLQALLRRSGIKGGLWERLPLK